MSIGLKEKLIKKSKELHIDKIGFASADTFVELKEKLVERIQKEYQASFEELDIEKRTEPNLSLRGAKSLIAIAMSYPHRAKNLPKSEPDQYRGIFSCSSWGEDYHKVLRVKLEQLRDYILNLYGSARVEIMIDTGPLSDRAVAERAGLGFVGKNSCLITEEFGSWVYLGHLLTDIYIEPDQPVLDSCGDCTRCIDACPTNALVQPGQLNSKLCISYLTQTKEILEDKEYQNIGNRLYGCDTCQIVCPKNRHVFFAHNHEFTPESEKVKPLLKKILFLSNREFKSEFGHMSGSWRGKTPIQRNAIIGLAHFKDKSAVEELIKILKEDHRTVIRATAAWALGKIGGQKSIAGLQEASKLENDSKVIGAINHALKSI